jgi:hypothetical protein
VQSEIEKLIEELDEDEVKVPAGLRRRIERVLKDDPTKSWDAVMRKVAEEDHR